MHFGPDAEKVSYYVDDFELVVVSKVKDLGVLVDNKLKFADHCVALNRKCNFICYSIIKLFSKRSPKEYFDLFKLYVRPLVDYNICFWFPTYSKYINVIENIQKRFTKRICPQGLSYSERLKYLSDSSIHDRFSQFSCHLVYKSSHGLLQMDHSFSLSPSFITRGNSKKLLVTFARSSIRKSFCTIRSVRFWNSLPVCRHLSKFSLF